MLGQNKKRFPFEWKNRSFWCTANGTVVPTEIFSQKRNDFRRISLFSFFTKMTGISLNPICLMHHNSLVRYAVYSPKLPVEKTVPLIPQRNNCFFHAHEKRSRPSIDGCMTFKSQAAAGNFGGGLLFPKPFLRTKNSVKESERIKIPFCYELLRCPREMVLYM